MAVYLYECLDGYVVAIRSKATPPPFLECAEDAVVDQQVDR